MANRMRRICVVEDDDDLRTMILSSLRHRGIDTSGHSTADQLPWEDLSADLFIVDVNLPGKLSGVELCRRLKSYERRKQVPVIMISGDPNLAGMAVAVNADAIVAKPFVFDELYRKIKRLL